MWAVYSGIIFFLLRLIRILSFFLKRIEKEVITKKERMIELCANPEEVDEEKIVAEQKIMEERFQALEEPLQERGLALGESLQFYQYKRDIEDAQVLRRNFSFIGKFPQQIIKKMVMFNN